MFKRIICGLYENTSLLHEEDELYQDIFTKTNIAAHALNPKNNYANLSARQKSVLRFYIAKLLNDPEEYSKFDEYLDGFGEFQHEELRSLNEKDYWTMMKGYCVKLYNLAFIFVSLPATIQLNDDKILQKLLKNCR